MKLTERRIRDLEPLSRQYFEFDDDLPGFGVRVGATGAKSFVVRYRVGGGRSGRQRRMSLGAVGTISLTEARAKARECLHAARQGGDPLGDVERYREAPTMNDLLSRYLTEHAKPKKASRSTLEDRRKIDGILRPTFGAHKAAEVTREDIEKLHRSMADRPVMANRTLALASKVFQLAEKWRIRPEHSNPCRLVERYREEPRDRYFTIDEMAALGAALDALEAGTAKDRDGVPYPVGNPSAVLALRLAAFLGLRIGEISAMRWQNIDLKEGTLRLPETKTGARFLTLPTEAQILLSNAPRIGECVVPGNNPDRPLDYKAIHRVWTRARDIAGLRNARIHDIRHTVATMAAETGAGAHVIRDLIGHKTLAMANRYVGRMNAPVRDLRQSVAGTIGAAMAGKVKGRGNERLGGEL